MRISDWSSDVCSSDLNALPRLLIACKQIVPTLAAAGARHQRAGGLGGFLSTGGCQPRHNQIAGEQFMRPDKLWWQQPQRHQVRQRLVQARREARIRRTLGHTHETLKTDKLAYHHHGLETPRSER